MFRQVNTTLDIITLPFDIITQSLDKSAVHLGIITLLLEIMRQRLGMSTLLLTTSDSCGVPYPLVQLASLTSIFYILMKIIVCCVICHNSLQACKYSARGVVEKYSAWAASGSTSLWVV